MNKLLIIFLLLLTGCTLEIDSRPSKGMGERADAKQPISESVNSMGKRADPKRPISEPGVLPTVEVQPVLTVTETHTLSSYTTIYRIFDSERNQVCYVTESYVYGGYDSSINCP